MEKTFATKNSNPINKVTRILLITTLFALPAIAAAASVENATISANQLTLNGTFTLPVQSVNLGGSNLQILSSSSTRIAAQLNPIPTMGTYVLTLQDGGDSDVLNIAVQAKVFEG